MTDPPDRLTADCHYCDGCDEYIGRASTFVRVGQSYNWVCDDCRAAIEAVLGGDTDD